MELEYHPESASVATPMQVSGTRNCTKTMQRLSNLSLSGITGHGNKVEVVAGSSIFRRSLGYFVGTVNPKTGDVSGPDFTGSGDAGPKSGAFYYGQRKRYPTAFLHPVYSSGSE